MAEHKNDDNPNVDGLINNFITKHQHRHTPSKASDYKIIKIINKGAFGEVRIVRNENNVFICKIITKKLLQAKKSNHDIVYKDSSNEFVLRLNHTFQDANYLYLIMPYCGGGDLMALLIKMDNISEKLTRFYISQVSAAIHYIHDKLDSFIRDLTPKNILICNDGHIRLNYLHSLHQSFQSTNDTQMNIWREYVATTKVMKQTDISQDSQPNVNGKHFYDTVGVPDYMAVEVLHTNKGYAKKVDWWSVGVIMFECLVGYSPFHANDALTACSNIMHYAQHFKVPNDIKLTQHAMDLMNRLVCPLADRIDFEGIEQHLWFNEVKWNDLKAQKPSYIPRVKSQVDACSFDDVEEEQSQQSGFYTAADAQNRVWGYTFNRNEDYAQSIGLTIGGSKDVNNFRECIEQNIMPSVASITFNGLFSEYYFATKTGKSVMKKLKQEEKQKDDGSTLFYPSYCYAKVKKLRFMEDDIFIAEKQNVLHYPAPVTNIDKDTNEYEYYMTVGLNSNIKMNEFKRKNLNLIIILDKSGSMGHGFKYGQTNTKMTIANECVVNLLKHLTNKDRFALVTFTNTAQIVQDLKFMANINVKELTDKILQISPGGGTNFECGYNTAINLYEWLFKAHATYNKCNDYSNRIILLTDAQPTEGKTDKKALLNIVETYSEKKIKNRIYTTFVGVGLDFNSTLIEMISETRGCNYYSVKSSQDFQDTMNEDFEYMVTPLVFNVVLVLKCEGNVCEIEKVYGSNNKQQDKILETGEITKIHTLFAAKKRSRKEGGGTKGGIQLIKLKKVSKDNNEIEGNMNVEIEVSFEDRNGKKYKNIQNVTFTAPKLGHKEMIDMIENEEDEDNKQEEIDNFYDNIGIRKGILLCKYAELVIEWIKSNKKHRTKALRINDKYKKIFVDFLQHFKREIKRCGDNDLKKEIIVMEKLIDLQSNDQHQQEEDDENEVEVQPQQGNRIWGYTFHRNAL